MEADKNFYSRFAIGLMEDETGDKSLAKNA